MTILVSIILAAVGIVLGFFIGQQIQKKKQAEDNAKQNRAADEIIQRAKREADEILKDAKIEAKDIIFKAKQEAEKEMKERRKDLQLVEKRLLTKEESIDKKIELIEKKEELISKKESEYDRKLAEVESMKIEVENMKIKMIAEIEKVASMTKEEAKNYLVSIMEAEAKQDAARIVREIEEEAKKEAEKKSKEIVATAIQRCAPEYVGEIAVSIVNLPSDEMKGRIIGREGRNIRTFESITGVDIIVDDTPEAVILSSYDPYRRELAKMTLEKLITDGRIHPTRIEEVYEKCKEELNKKILEVGEETAFRLGLHNIHPELLKLVGKLPIETTVVAFGILRDFFKNNWIGKLENDLFYYIKSTVDTIFSRYGLESDYKTAREAFLHPGKSADLIVDGDKIGFVGELHPEIYQFLDINESVYIAEINLKMLSEKAGKKNKRYEKLSQFPYVYKDISVVVSKDIAAIELSKFIKGYSSLIKDVEIFDRYVGDKIGVDKVSLAFRIYFNHLEKTLTDDETNEIVEKIIKSLEERFGASLR